ncbi:MAG TPA: bifunctional phosphoribosyl-AMP cyclohydrolase/phosphoribosyl-ATP diphosphatase HisIE [Gemmatimonadaceae bacterium]|jgi:phosphoribosyl-ATP pyrophosphohydrolase/phosphoribosyl-AMP cyclohydrolase|nr:bifunctional phosphoribosyl-AMP cyclohydrolase/phosphoribosyl-ATP diphosphatase HisIE [Gemmatimonadaceae bacterium]
MTAMLDLDRLDFTKGGGLVTVVTQDAESGAVLMVAFADREALERTIETGEMHYRSRTRGLWHKGATSGNVQQVLSLDADCDGDAVLARVRSEGPACHTGSRSCFGERALAADALGVLDATIDERAATAGVSRSADAAGKPSYTRRLLDDRNLRLKKIGEESAELVTAAADGDAPRAIEECADLVFHALVALHSAGGSLADVRRTLAARVGAPRR